LQHEEEPGGRFVLQAVANLTTHDFAGAALSTLFVMAGLVPAIHALLKFLHGGRFRLHHVVGAGMP
jgi:hypothetical protein